MCLYIAYELAMSFCSSGPVIMFLRLVFFRLLTGCGVHGLHALHSSVPEDRREHSLDRVVWT